jgi:eukaryotic-like serine/threonine-protein kinase
MIGQTISHYQILRELGDGGKGAVYEAQDLRLGRRVALRVLSEGLTKEPQALERFSREARAASALNHPNICTIFDIGEHEGHAFVAMEYLEGQTLERLMAVRPIEFEQLLKIAIETADALSTAHALRWVFISGQVQLS